MLEQNKVFIYVQRGTAYSLFVTDRAVPLSGSALQTAMNALGPERCMSDLARSTRTTLRVHTYTYNVAEAAAQRLSEAFYGMVVLVAAFECECESDPVSLTRSSLTLAGDFEST